MSLRYLLIFILLYWAAVADDKIDTLTTRLDALTSASSP